MSEYVAVTTSPALLNESPTAYVFTVGSVVTAIEVSVFAGPSVLTCSNFVNLNPPFPFERAKTTRNVSGTVASTVSVFSVLSSSVPQETSAVCPRIFPSAGSTMRILFWLSEPPFTVVKVKVIFSFPAFGAFTLR